MYCRKGALLFAALVALAQPVLASQPILFTRAGLHIERAAPPAGEPADTNFDAEMRDAASAARTPGWFNFIAPAQGHAVFLTYSSAQEVALVPAQNFAPLDVLFVDEYGFITKIAPSLVLANLKEPIPSEKPVLVMIYLRAGSCERLSIKPGDRVVGDIFKRRPAVLTAPGKPEEKVKDSVPAAPHPAEQGQ